MNYEQDIVNRLRDTLIGKKVVGFRYMTKTEMDDMGWYTRPIVITFEDGTEVSPMSDDEGNGGGALVTNIEGYETVGVIR